MKTLLNAALIMLFSFTVALAIDAKVPRHGYTHRYYAKLRQKAQQARVVKHRVVRKAKYVFASSEAIND